MAFLNKDLHKLLQVKDLFKEIGSVGSLDKLEEKLREIFVKAGYSIKDLEGYASYGKESDLWPFSGLGIFFTKYVVQDEKKEFIDKILPYIASMARKMIDYLEGGKLPLQRLGNGIDLQMNYQVVVSLLACHFFCGLSFSSNHNFAETLGKFCGKSGQDVIASKLRCIIQFFRRLSLRDSDWCSSRMVKFSRKEIPHKLPDLEKWLTSKSSLCPVKVDSSNYITDADGGTTEFNFVRSFAKDDCSVEEQGTQGYMEKSREEFKSSVYGDDLGVFVYPELLVAKWILQDVNLGHTVIAKTDDWNNIHVVTNGVAIHPLNLHDYQQTICDELNRMWFGLSSYTSRRPTSDENICYFEKNQGSKSDVSTAEKKTSLLTGDPSVKTVSAAGTNFTHIRMFGDGMAGTTAAIDSYSELLSKFLLKNATQYVAKNVRIFGKSDQQSREPSDEKNRCLTNAPHSKLDKSVPSTFNYTYTDLLVEFLTSSVNHAVNLVDSISEVVSDELIYSSPQRDNGLHQAFAVRELTSKLSGSVISSTDKLSHHNFSPSVKSHCGKINEDYACHREVTGRGKPSSNDELHSYREMMASNLAKSIMQSALLHASRCLSPKAEIITNKTNEIPTESEHNLGTLSSNTNSAAVISVEGSKNTNTFSKQDTDVPPESRSKTNNTFPNDCSLITACGSCISKNHGHGVLDAFTERMSSNILSSVLERARSARCPKGRKDSTRSSPCNGISRCAHDEDIQLHIVMQWIVASEMGRPCLICYTNIEMESNKIAWISDRAHKNGWLVSDIVKCILEYYQTKLKSHISDRLTLLDVLQSKIKEPKD